MLADAARAGHGLFLPSSPQRPQEPPRPHCSSHRRGQGLSCIRGWDRCVILLLVPPSGHWVVVWLLAIWLSDIPGKPPVSFPIRPVDCSVAIYRVSGISASLEKPRSRYIPGPRPRQLGIDLPPGAATTLARALSRSAACAACPAVGIRCAAA